MNSLSDRATEAVKQTLVLLGVSLTDVSVRDGEEGEILVDVTVADEESGLLIGYHGETLTALQYLLGQIINKGADQWSRVVVNVNQYRDQRELQLKQMAQNAADRAVSTGDEIEMPYLTPAERRIIHLELATRDDVTSYSEGDGRSRRLIIGPKAK